MNHDQTKQIRYFKESSSHNYLMKINGINMFEHHSTPQKMDHDPDLRTLPLVAFCIETAQRAKHPLMKKWISVQNYLFVPVTCILVSLSWIFYLHPRMIIRHGEWLEASLIMSKFASCGYLGFWYFGWNVVWMYVAAGWVGSIYIFMNFTVSHTHLPTVPKVIFLFIYETFFKIFCRSYEEF